MAARAPRLYLIDGSSYVYRAFFALPPLTGPNGLPTNAVYGFTTMVLKLLNDVAPEYLAVVFDAPGKTFRDDLFESYKANRPGTPPDLSAQIASVHEVVAAFRIPELSVPGVEADDVIATLIDRLVPEGIESVVITADKDLMQLVGPRVRLWDTMRDRWVDEAAVVARFGVPPAQVVEVLALMGDTVDNIPGVKGIGEKTAMALIRELGSVEGVLSHLAEVERMKLRGAKAVAERLRDNADLARLSRELATLRRDVPVESSLERLRLPGPDTAALRALFSRLGFQSLLPQLVTHAEPLIVDTGVLHGADDVRRYLAARENGPVAIVTLVDDGPPATTPAREVILCDASGPPTIVSLAAPDTSAALAGWIGRGDLRLVGHDLKRDLLHLAAGGMAVGSNGFDVMIASYLLEASPTHRLEELATDVLGARLDGFRQSVHGTAAGASLLCRLAEPLAARLEERGLKTLFEQVEMPLTHILAAMERRGILVDVGRLQELSREITGRLEGLMRDIHALAGEEFNINSAPQLRAILFDRLRLPKQGVRRGKTGYSTDVDVLTRLAQVHPLPAKILEYRALAKLKSTYVDALPAAVNPVTGRLHTTFNQTVAATGRLSSSDPNLQNIPVRGGEGRRIREAFVAPPGHMLLAADYSQIELRILAHLSGDPAFVDAFRSEQDIHNRTAAEVFGVLPGLVSADMRRAAKVINFGIIYGMGPQRLAHELGISLADAQRYIEQYFARYAGVRSYMQSVIEEARARGYVTTILGRRRSVPELRSTERGVAQAAERVATNTPIQGSAADLIKKAMVAVERRLRRQGLPASLLLQVHDELVLETAEAAVEATKTAVREEMEGVMSLAAPLRVDLGVGRTWAEAH
jgi:DNA polymerase-1